MRTIGNYEYKILSHLKDKQRYTWGNISSLLLDINDSTLLDNLKRLERSESIIKEKTLVEGKIKKLYRITKIGLDKHRVLKTLTEGIAYPPSYIPFESDKERIIWLLNTNEFCRWKHFEDKRLGIRVGSLNNLLNRLRQNRIIEKQMIQEVNRPVYRILDKGREQFMVMLEKYSVDKEFAQRERIKKIKGIIDKTEDFVDIIDIDDEEVLVRFCKYVDLFKNEKLRNVCKNNEHFYITLLYLAFNHPYRFPNYVPIEIFSKKFGISETALLYYLEFLDDPELKDFFVKITLPSKGKNFIYYFLKKGKLSQRLGLIIEEYAEQKIFRDALKGQKIAMDDTFLSKMDISLLNKAIFEPYNILSKGLKRADFVRRYLEQLSSQYTLKETQLTIDSLVKELLRGKFSSEE